MPRKNLRTRLARVVAVAVAQILLVAAVAAQNVERDDRALANFHQVNERLYRGAQPRGDGIKRLASMGVKTILNLRRADEHATAEQAEAEQSGLRYFNVPLAWHRRPSGEEIASALAVVNAPENWPVFVHCKRGADRTGTVVAIYRIAHDGWTADNAVNEASRLGMRWSQFEMKEFIVDHYERQLRHANAFTAPGGDDDHTRIHVAGKAAFATRRAVEKSFAFTRKGLGRLRKIF